MGPRVHERKHEEDDVARHLPPPERDKRRDDICTSQQGEAFKETKEVQLTRHGPSFASTGPMPSLTVPGPANTHLNHFRKWDHHVNNDWGAADRDTEWRVRPFIRKPVLDTGQGQGGVVNIGGDKISRRPHQWVVGGEGKDLDVPLTRHGPFEVVNRLVLSETHPRRLQEPKRRVDDPLLGETETCIKKGASLKRDQPFALVKAETV